MESKTARTIPARYKLSEALYRSTWEPVQRKVFSKAGNGRGLSLPDQTFGNAFDFAFINSGYHINREDFLALKRAMRNLGEDRFAMIEAGLPTETAIRLSYPSGISLSDYTPYQDKLDNDLQFIVENFPSRFYLFGQRSDWGVFSSEPHDIVVVGFKGKAKKAFENLYVTDQEEVMSWFEHEAFADFREEFRSNYLSRPS